MELTLISTCVQSVESESSESLANMRVVVIGIVGVYQNVIKVDHNTNVEEVQINFVHKMLKGGWCVRKSERHNIPFVRTIASAEHRLAFMAFSDADKVICVVEVNLGVDPGLLGGVEEVSSEQDQISVFLCNAIQTTEIHTQPEGAILLFDE
jgi:hypothetical protein